jgi:hypothetical protein
LFCSTGTITALKQFWARIKWIQFLHSFLHSGEEPIQMVEGPVLFWAVETRKEKPVFVSGQFSFQASPKQIHILVSIWIENGIQ